MNNKSQFFDELKSKKIAVIGTGVSHRELIPMFLKQGYDITFCDKRELEKIPEALEYQTLGAKLSLGENYLDAIFNCDVVFRTPGMYFGNAALTKARERGIVVTSELEVFFTLCPCKTYCVTGSDGKTTTTTLISEMLKAEGKNVILGGNIGKALLPQIFDIKESDCVVAELSSFQLMSMRTSPDVAVITNITPNHLDVHGTMDEYIGCKKNILLHQNAFSRAVLNRENAETMNLNNLVRGELLTFGRASLPAFDGSFLDEDGFLCLTRNGITEKIVHKDNIKIPGTHNIENYLAAISALAGEVSAETVKNVAENFGGVPHRIEFIREISGVKFYNDSIATSPTRVIAGLRAFGRKIIVIAGGYDKKIPYEPLGEDVNRFVKVLVTLGATAEKIENAVKSHADFSPENIKIIRTKTLEEAVEKAFEYAENGDVITLSPASASFDLYRNFEERGEHFRRIVNAL